MRGAGGVVGEVVLEVSEEGGGYRDEGLVYEVGSGEKGEEVGFVLVLEG